MTALVLPDLRYRDSWLAAVDEFLADGTVMNGSGLWEWDHADRREETLAAEVARLRAEADPARQRPEGMVPSSYFWIVEDDEFLGYVAVRHRLTPWLLEEGGHIGYAVRPSRRRQGHATRALDLALGHARALGLDRVLLTAEEDNRPSQIVIERCGGRYEDTRKGKRRYWIALGT